MWASGKGTRKLYLFPAVFLSWGGGDRKFSYRFKLKPFKAIITDLKGFKIE
jgi:hypothetical protein